MQSIDINRNQGLCEYCRQWIPMPVGFIVLPLHYRKGEKRPCEGTYMKPKYTSALRIKNLEIKFDKTEMESNGE